MAFLLYFGCMKQIMVNGKLLPADEPALAADNRGYRYGDGLFETLKVVNGQIALAGYHFDRLMQGLQLLRFHLPALLTPARLQEEILRLCRKNGCEQLARVRLSFSRGSGGLYETGDAPVYLAECWPLADHFQQWNENGLVTGWYKDAVKTCDAFSGLKTASFLPYVMAALHAREQKWNECFLLNDRHTVADATIANVFMIKNGRIHTPPLSDGGVNGVMRRHLLTVLPEAGYSVEEKSLTPGDLADADELFLTNAISGMRWVRQFGDSQYTCTEAAGIYHRFVQTIW